MLIADAQVHIWVANSPERPWRKGVEYPRRPPLTADLLLREMDAAGVDRVVIVPPTIDDDRNDLGLDAARRHPDRFAVMGRLDLDSPGARERIAGWRSQPGMLGLRYSFQRPWVGPALREGRIDWLWEEAERAGVPIMMLITWDLVPLIDQVAARHPRLKIVLDHLALPLGTKDDEAFRDLGLLLPLAQRPNIAVKSSALPVYTSDPYPFRNVHAHVRRVFESFGPRRMFWGSDLSRLQCTYGECVRMFTHELPWLAGDDLEWVMGRGLCEWIGWKV